MTEQISGEQLKTLRLAAGLDVAVLARRVSLSTAQLLQLENDQHSLFYTPAIRRHAARKVLAHLASQPAQEQPGDVLICAAEPAPPDLTVLLPPRDGQAASSASRVVLGELPIQDLSEQLEPTIGLGPARAPASAGGRAAALDPSAGRAGWYPGWGWLALVLVVASLSAWLVLKRPFQSISTPASERPWTAQTVGLGEPSPAPMADGLNKPASAGSVPRAQPQDKLERDLVALAPASSLPASPALASAPARPNEAITCPDRLESAPVIALKSSPGQASLIYLLSSVGQVVCVLDGSGKLKPHRLEPGQVKGVAGPPPWTLQASSLQTIQLYFQGGRVKLPAEAQDRVQLLAPR